MQTWQVILLGLIEGLTEFLPVSSTGHLLLVGHFLGFHSPGRTFEVLIQLGAILAVATVYAAKLWQLVCDLPSSARARWFVLAVLVAFLPAALIGAAGHRYIKAVLFETPWLICVTLVVGGVVLLSVDKLRLKPRYRDLQPLAFAVALIVPALALSGFASAGFYLWPSIDSVGGMARYNVDLASMSAHDRELLNQWRWGLEYGFWVALGGTLLARWLRTRIGATYRLRHASGRLITAPVGRSIAMALLGGVAAAWALASLVSG